MRILCDYTPAGPHFVRTGWARVFRCLGHDFTFWDRQRGGTAFDVFDGCAPTAYLGTCYDLDEATVKCIQERPEMKVALFASGWGEAVDSLDPDEYPIVRVTPEERDRLARLKDETGKPDFVFLHVSQGNLERVLGGWRSIGIKPVGILNAADAFVLDGAKYREELACDFGFVGSRWGYKSRNLDRYLLPLLQSGLKGRLFGASGWQNVPQWMGTISEEDKRDLFYSARVCPNVSEPHSTSSYGSDIVERVYQVPFAGGCLVSDYVAEIDEVFGMDTVPMAKSPSDYASLVEFYAAPASEPERLGVIERTQNIVRRGHTYFERVGQMLTEFGLHEEAARAKQAKEKFFPWN